MTSWRRNYGKRETTHRTDRGLELATRVEQPQLVHVLPQVPLLELGRVARHPRVLQRFLGGNSLVLITKIKTKTKNARFLQPFFFNLRKNHRIWRLRLLAYLPTAIEQIFFITRFLLSRASSQRLFVGLFSAQVVVRPPPSIADKTVVILRVPCSTVDTL